MVGNLVQVSWLFNPPLGSVHSKSKIGWLIGVSGRQKEGILSSELCALVSVVAGKLEVCRGSEPSDG